MFTHRHSYETDCLVAKVSPSRSPLGKSQEHGERDTNRTDVRHHLGRSERQGGARVLLPAEFIEPIQYLYSRAEAQVQARMHACEWKLSLRNSEDESAGEDTRSIIKHRTDRGEHKRVHRRASTDDAFRGSIVRQEHAVYHYSWSRGSGTKISSPLIVRLPARTCASGWHFEH